MLEFLFLNLRLKAIKNTAYILHSSNSNIFYSAFSQSQIERAIKNRKLNRGWFMRNYLKIKSRFSNDEFSQLAEDLGFTYYDLERIEMASIEQRENK